MNSEANEQLWWYNIVISTEIRVVTPTNFGVPNNHRRAMFVAPHPISQLTMHIISSRCLYGLYEHVKYGWNGICQHFKFLKNLDQPWVVAQVLWFSLFTNKVEIFCTDVQNLLVTLQARIMAILFLAQLLGFSAVHRASGQLGLDSRRLPTRPPIECARSNPLVACYLMFLTWHDCNL